MKIYAKKVTVLEDDYTIYQRVVQLNDGSNLFQLHVSSYEDFKIYESTTFASKEQAIKIMNII